MPYHYEATSEFMQSVSEVEKLVALASFDDENRTLFLKLAAVSLVTKFQVFVEKALDEFRYKLNGMTSGRLSLYMKMNAIRLSIKVGAYGLPDGVIRDPKAVVGQFATADLFAGDYLSAEKLGRDSAGATDILGTLNGEKVAISVAIGSYSEGLSNKLQNGDIVSIIIYDKDKYMSYIPPELKYVRIITTTTSGGIDRDENTEGEKAVTATVLVTPEQAELLSMYENVTSLHFVLVYRGDKATADAYLKAQDDYLNSHKGQTPAIDENSEKEDVSEGEQNG